MESSTRNHYALVAADIRHELSALDNELERIKDKREKLHTALGFIEERMETMDSGEKSVDEKPAGPYAGLSLVDATVKYLETVKRPSPTRAIADALAKGGYQTKSKNLYNNVYGILNREGDKPSPRVVKKGAQWELPAGATSDDDEAAAASEEQTPANGSSR